MDAITSVVFDLSAAATQPAGAAAIPAANAANAANAATSVFDVGHFDAAYAAAAHAPAPSAAATPKVSAADAGGFGSVMAMLQGLNGHAESIGVTASRNGTAQGRMTPADMLAITTQAYEFLFHCELTSNVANRTSEGVQQLFQQQS